jgi:WD40 repeat protein
MRHTKGHVGAITLCQWHPNDKNCFLTSSVDGTVRIWDAGDKWKQKQVIAVKSKLPGGRTPITSATYSPNGKLIAACMSLMFF